MYSRSRGILYAELPSADEGEHEGTRTRTRAPDDDADSSLEEPSTTDAPSLSSRGSSVPEPADD